MGEVGGNYKLGYKLTKIIIIPTYWDLKANVECAVSHPHKSVIRK